MAGTYLEKKALKPTGVYYVFTQEEIDTLVREYVTDRTGFEIDLEAGCYAVPSDVYISWVASGDEKTEKLVEDFLEYEQNNEYPTGIVPFEDFMNRDNLFQNIFGTSYISYNYDKEEEIYTLYVEVRTEQNV